MGEMIDVVISPPYLPIPSAAAPRMRGTKKTREIDSRSNQGEKQRVLTTSKASEPKRGVLPPLDCLP